MHTEAQFLLELPVAVFVASACVHIADLDIYQLSYYIAFRKLVYALNLDFRFIKLLFFFVVIRRLGENIMSETSLVQLQKKRSELENDLSSASQKEAALQKELKTLEEELANQLQEKIKAKNASVEKLESTKGDLERRLKELREYQEPSPPPAEPVATEVQLQEQPSEATEVASATEESQQTYEVKDRHREDKRRKWL